MSIAVEVQTRKSYPDKVTVDFALVANDERFNITLLESNFIELLGLLGGDPQGYLTQQLTPLDTLTKTFGAKTGVAPVIL